MNRVYFVRHAKADYLVHEDLIRPLTDEGINDSKKLVEFFRDKNITKMYSSPYKRCVDTIREVANAFKLDIEIINDFRERKISNDWIEDFNNFSQKQWKNFDYKLIDGESLKEVQDRNIKELHRILNKRTNHNIVIGTHGTALSTIINYYDNSFEYLSFEKIKNIMPWIVCIEFDGTNILNLNQYFSL